MMRKFLILAALLISSALAFVNIDVDNINGRGKLFQTQAASDTLGLYTAIGDFNGDLFDDLAVGDRVEFKISIVYGPLIGSGMSLLNNTAKTVYTYPAVVGGEGLTFCDLDADGKSDLVMTNGASSAIIWGSAQPPLTIDYSETSLVTHLTGDSLVSPPCCLDFEGDGSRKLALASSSGPVYVLPTLNPRPLSDVPVNVDSKIFQYNISANGLSAGKIAGNLKEDLVISRNQNIVQVVFGGSDSFNFSEPSTGLWFSIESNISINAVTTDFNNDGFSDIFVFEDNQVICIYGQQTMDPFYNLTDLGTTPHLTIFGQTFPYSNTLFPIGDFSGDGVRDIAISSGTKVYVLFGFNDPTLTEIDLAVSLPLTHGVTISGIHTKHFPVGSAVIFGDLDHDTISDFTFIYDSLSERTAVVIYGGTCQNKYWDSGTCMECNCDVCSATTGECLWCPENHWIESDQRCKTCGTGCADCNVMGHVCSSCLNASFWPSGANCITCDLSCKVCNPALATCAECGVGEHISSLGCVECGNHTWNNISSAHNCLPCINCVLCNPLNGRCTLCNTTSEIAYDGTCTPCQPGFSSDPPGIKCKGCPLGFGCLECSAEGKCKKCPTGKYISGDRCRDCNTGSWSAGGNKTSCDTCSTTGGCLGCDPLNGHCTGCPVHSGLGPSGCTTCSSTQYSTGKTPCQDCLLRESCSACDQRTGVCTKCPETTGLYGSGCQQCIIGKEFVNEAGYCELCTTIVTGCLACDIKTGKCSKCAENYVMIENECHLKKDLSNYTDVETLSSDASVHFILASLVLAILLAFQAF